MTRDGEDRTEDLLRRTQSGDAEALQALLLEHLPMLRAFVRVRMSPLLRAHESESDLVQSACRDVLGHLADFEWRGEEAFRGWLCTATFNKLLQKERSLRAQKRDARRERALDGDAGSHGPTLADCYAQALSPSGEVIAEERVRVLEAAFDALPPDYREAISLSRFARLSRAQIAATMGRSEDSVRGLLQRGLAMLAEAIDKQTTADER